MSISLKALYDQVQGLSSSGRPKIDLLFNSSITAGNIKLSKSAKNYDFIIILGSNDGGYCPTFRITPTKLPIKGASKEWCLWDRDMLTWQGNISSDGLTIVLNKEDSMVHSIFGLSFNCLYNI